MRFHSHAPVLEPRSAASSNSQQAERQQVRSRAPHLRDLGNRGTRQLLARGEPARAPGPSRAAPASSYGKGLAEAASRVPISQPHDSQERRADELAAGALTHGPGFSGLEPSVEGTRALTLRESVWAQAAFGYDFSRVRLHGGTEAKQLASAYEARAFTLGNDIVLGEGAEGVIAHELAHVALDAGRSTRIQRKTPGEVVAEKAHTGFLDPDAAVKADVDVLRAALREIKAGKAVEYNRKAGKGRIAAALNTLGKAASAATVEAEWDALANGRAKSGTTPYGAAERAFFARFETPLAALSRAHPKAQSKYWLKNTPTQVLDAIFSAADANMPADQLYAYAMKEGLVDYVRRETAVSAGADPSTAQLASVSTTKAISGFDFLGTDDFFTELTAKKEPLSAHLPGAYDVLALTKDDRTNEQGRIVHSAIFPNLLVGLQALAAMLKRRRALFLADAAAQGYGTPSTDELIYWTYVYYNSGEFNGQLAKFRGKRKLGDWIANSEYPNSIKVLESWRMIRDMKIF